jgi:hypothetical protein
MLGCHHAIELIKGANTFFGVRNLPTDNDDLIGLLQARMDALKSMGFII